VAHMSRFAARASTCDSPPTVAGSGIGTGSEMNRWTDRRADAIGAPAASDGASAAAARTKALSSTPAARTQAPSSTPAALG
jgi:hypothetical protein